MVWWWCVVVCGGVVEVYGEVTLGGEHGGKLW